MNKIHFVFCLFFVVVVVCFICYLSLSSFYFYIFSTFIYKIKTKDYTFFSKMYRNFDQALFYTPLLEHPHIKLDMFF